jgi:hypothetical protein
MEYVFIQRPGDREAVAAIVKEFEKLSKSQLVNQYNRMVQIGIVGVHAQALRIVALHNVFNRVFGISPIGVEDNVLIKLLGEIELRGEGWFYK